MRDGRVPDRDGFDSDGDGPKDFPAAHVEESPPQRVGILEQVTAARQPTRKTTG